MTSKDSFPCMCGLFNRNNEFNQLFGGSASGSMPRMNPPTATGGNPRPPQQARRSRGRTTGYTKPSRTTNRHQPVKVTHWNAEGVLNKQTDLQHVLHENTSATKNIL